MTSSFCDKILLAKCTLFISVGVYVFYETNKNQLSACHVDLVCERTDTRQECLYELVLQSGSSKKKALNIPFYHHK